MQFPDLQGMRSCSGLAATSPLWQFTLPKCKRTNGLQGWRARLLLSWGGWAQSIGASRLAAYPDLWSDTKSVG